MNKADLILHPIRMRILTALVNRRLTAKELATDLSDVPQATLYRHINALVQGGILVIAEENPVRGTVEKVYTLEASAARLTPEDVEGLNRDDYMQMFTVFITTILRDFALYLEAQEEIDLFADGVSFSRLPLYLSDQEVQELSEAVQELLLSHQHNQPGGDRRRRILASILLPDDSSSSQE